MADTIIQKRIYDLTNTFIPDSVSELSNWYFAIDRNGDTEASKIPATSMIVTPPLIDNFITTSKTVIIDLTEYNIQDVDYYIDIKVYKNETVGGHVYRNWMSIFDIEKTLTSYTFTANEIGLNVEFLIVF